MTERKPPGVSVQTWVERQIRQAQDRGEFDDLPGAGKPLPGLTGADDELWWVKQFMRREGLTFALPPALALKKEAEGLPARLARERSAGAVRRIVEDFNKRILLVTRRPPEGPPLRLMPLDVETVVDEWRTARDVRHRA